MVNEDRTPRVVVGIDGSDNGRAALEWAAVEADRRGVPLRIVHALGMPLVVTAYGGPARFEPTEEIQGQAAEVLRDAAAHVAEVRPGVEAETVTALEEAPLALLRQSHPHDLLVVGTRGMGTVKAMFVGSVSVRLAAQAPCPVAVVPAHDGKPTATGLKRIVVGVDGSPNSRRALGAAVDLVAGTGGELVVVHSWEVPYPYDPVALTASGFQPQEDLFEKQSEQLVAEMLAEAIDEQRDDVAIDVTVVRTQDAPVNAILKAAEGADAIVVGSRGRGTVRGLLLGSVSQGLLHHSKIPVVVLPKQADED
ncbi:Universal stress protein [Nocardiopsis dassonvillei]|uniref:universal stress protein n=1 Tax=Nocardiopsis dassonvillei TaxID=2014 RepID=UPI003F559AF0